MNALAGMENFLSWLLNHSLQAGALVLFVLLLQRIFRRQLTHRWRFALWWIVVVRLVLPIGPESAASVFNFFRPAVTLQKPVAMVLPQAPTPAQDRAAVPAENMPWQYERPAPFPAPEPVPLAPVVVTPAHSAPARPALSLASGLALLWLAGVVVLSGGVLIQIARFQVRLRRAVAPPPPDAAELLEACRREFPVRRRLELLETDLVGSPALFGLFRLRLLLPRGLAGRFNAGELRYIFLHELAHVKRGDLWINWLVTALQIMHWFNPLIWFGFARLRSDRELACDELTLLRAGEKVATSYGETVIKLLEGLGRPAAIPGLVGILEDKNQMRRRIRMIAAFRRPGRWSALAALLLAVVAVATLTDAQTQKPANLSAKNGSAAGKISATNSVAGPGGTRSSSRDWTISGRVLDAETKQPVDHFRITLGQIDDFERIDWTTHLGDGTNGFYRARISKRFGQPYLKVDADRYLPVSAVVLPRDATNVDFYLTKGSGPVGRVVLPNGEPAVGATIVLFCDGWNQASFHSETELAILHVGQFDVYHNDEAVHHTDTKGAFSFKAEWGTKAVAAASPQGFAAVSLTSLATNSTITLEPYGRIIGTLKRGSGPAVDERLDLSFADANLPTYVNLNHHAVTDARGRFSFEHVPAGNLQILSRGTTAAPIPPWRINSLRQVELRAGQTLELSLETTTNPTPPIISSPPWAVRPIRPMGTEVTGVVLSPDGKPAADAQVALQVTGIRLTLGKATLNTSERHGALVKSDARGNFALPMFEGATSVIALNDDGFAQVALDGLKTSPRIRLQPWGQIEGTLRFNGHPGTNETITIDSADFSPLRLYYDVGAFRTRTDAQGKFAVTYVPPGEHHLFRVIAKKETLGKVSRVFYPLGPVDVKPDETVRVNLDAGGRTVVGTVKFTEPGATFPHTTARASIHTPFKSRKYNTTEEMKSAMQSEEHKKEMRDSRNYFVALESDGSFRAEDIPPGQYDFNVIFPDMPNDPSFYGFMSRTPITIPESRTESDSAPVDLGLIEVKKRPILPAAPEAQTK